MTLPRNVDDIYPLSPMQRLMLLHAISPSSDGVLLNQVCYRILGDLDASAFHRAWDSVVARHPALRTAFLYEGLPRPLQAVRGVVTLPFQHLDLSDVPAAARADRLGALRRDDANAPMPLGRAPLMRCTLVRLAPDESYFIWTVHHLVVDRWSHAVLFSELCTLYAAYARGEQPALGRPVTFRDYVEWTTRQDEAAAEWFWREELAGVREPTLLAPAGPSTGHARRTTRHALSSDAMARVRERAAQLRITPAALLTAAVGLVIANRTGRDDVVCGITVSGRPPGLPDADAMVGSFVNNLPVRITIRPDRAISDWLRDVQRAQIRRETYGHVSLAAIQSWSDIPPSRPLFDTLVLLNLTDVAGGTWAGIRLVPDTATLDAAVPLLLSATMDGDRLAFTLVHDDSFDAPARLLAEVETAIARVATADLTARVADLIPVAYGEAPNVRTPCEFPREPRVNGRRQATAVATADALLQAWRDVLAIESVGLDDDFFAMGGTSLQAAQLFVRVERITGKTLPLSTLVGAGSVRALLAAIDRPVQRDSAIVGLRSSGSEPPLYAIPGIGGNVVGLAGLARALGPEQPFIALESPGLDGREPPLTSIEAIGERYARDVAGHETRPFHLLGLCWGAAVVAEMTRHLAALGRTPLSLTLVNPAVLLREAGPTRAAIDKADFLRSRLELYWDEFRERDWADRTRLLASKARRAAKILAGGEERRQSQSEVNQFRVMEANRDAIIRYVPAPVEARARVFVTRHRGDGADPRLEWLSLIQPRPDVVTIPGVDSGDTIAPANVGHVATAVQRWLRESASDRSVPR